MKSFRSLLTLLGAMAVTSAALATAVVAVIGYVPETGVQGFPGLVVSGGTNSAMPVRDVHIRDSVFRRVAAANILHHVEGFTARQVVFPAPA